MLYEEDEGTIEECQVKYYDDVSGKWLDSGLVEAAREEEMLVFKQHNVYTKVPYEECLRMTGKEPKAHRMPVA